MTLLRLVKKAGYRARTAMILALIALVAAGGICPALYGEILPHAHLFIGGPPPPHWQHHEHPNPLVTFFGSLRTDPNDGQLQETTPLHSSNFATGSLAEGRVLSVYEGASTIILSLIAFDLIVALLAAIYPLAVSFQINLTVSRSTPQTADGPIPPPPRFAELLLIHA
jgi:hypothetical protein